MSYINRFTRPLNIFRNSVCRRNFVSKEKLNKICPDSAKPNGTTLNIMMSSIADSTASSTTDSTTDSTIGPTKDITLGTILEQWKKQEQEWKEWKERKEQKERKERNRLETQSDVQEKSM